MTAGSTHSSAAVHRQPPAAERARHGGRAARGLALRRRARASPALGATTTDAGDVLLVVPTDGAMTTALRNSPLGDVPARLTVTDRAPCPLPHPVRGLLQLSGWVEPVPEYDVTRLVLDFADAQPCDSLFDVGLSATLVRLDLGEVLLEEAGSTRRSSRRTSSPPRPDAVSRSESELMAEQCAGRWTGSRGGVQQRIDRHDDVRLLGLDRFGVRYRVQSRTAATTCGAVHRAAARPGRVRGAIDRLLACGPA